MKSCIYLTRHVSNGMWYVGSHKDSSNIATKQYIGSGINLAEAIEEFGIDSFTCEVLKEFDDRNEAFKGEHQLLNHLDAAGDDNSYNITNDSWPKEGFLTRVFGSKKGGPLSENEIQEFADKILSSDQSAENTAKSTKFKDQMKDAAKAAYLSGEELGMLYASTEAYKREKGVFKAKLIDHVESQIDIRDRDIQVIKKIKKTTGVVSPHAAVRLVELKKDLEMLKKEKKKIKKGKGWGLIVSNSFAKGFNSGAKTHVDLLLRQKGLLE